MKKKRNKTHEAYVRAGKILCAVAGGIVGTVLGGPAMAIPGVVLGYLIGHILEQGSLHILNTTSISR